MHSSTMADDVLVTVFGTSNIILQNESLLDKNRVVQRRTTGADIFPGALVGEVGDTFPDIDLAAAGELVLGFAWRHSIESDIPVGWQNPDADSPVYVFADNTYIDVIESHGGALEIAAVIAPRTTNANNITGNELLKASTGGELDVYAGTTAALEICKATSDQAITVDTTDARRVIVKW